MPRFSSTHLMLSVGGSTTVAAKLSVVVFVRLEGARVRNVRYRRHRRRRHGARVPYAHNHEK